MTTFTDRLKNPDVSLVVLIEATVGERLLFWTDDGGGDFSAPTIAGPSRTVEDVLVDGESVSFTWDRANEKITITPAGGDPYAVTVQAILKFHFSNRARVYNGIYYEPRIASLPNMSIRVEHKFGDPGQLGGGDLILKNNDGFFDSLAGLHWDAGEVSIKVGADPLDGTDCIYADFDPFGAWKVKAWERKRESFQIQFEEKKGALKIKIPTDLYSRDDYPLIREEDVGKPIQTAYGKIFDATPICIDTANRTLKVAGHAIPFGFFGFRVKNEATEQWVNVSPTEIDLDGTGSIGEEATFRLSASDWDLHAAVACDFYGKANADGTLMTNPADVERDILISHIGLDLYDFA